MMNADNLISDKVICSGIVKPDDAARGCGDVKDGFENKYVFRGFAYIVDISASVNATTRDPLGKILRVYPCAILFQTPRMLESKGLNVLKI